MSSCPGSINSPKGYERHRPEKTLLYQVIAKHIKLFFKKCEESGHPVPNFIRKEFEGFLRCGVLSYGFARVYCQECKYDRLIGFSCKKRGFCGSCLARRMSETSGRLLDEIIPHIPTRQWVLSVPAPLRYLIAYDNDALNIVMTVFMNTLSSYLRLKAKKSGGKALGATDYFAGSVSVIQRFGSACNLNTHIHSQVSDGAYALLPDDKPHFLRVAPPSEEEIKKLTIKIACRIHRYLEKRMEEVDHDELLEKQPLLAKCYAASIRYLSAFGLSRGKPLLRVIDQRDANPEIKDERTVMGFNLHASEAIESEDRAGLERTLRYMGRPPLSKERLKMAADGERLILTLKSKWRDGTEKILLTPTDLVERLVALIPPPRKNQIRYHGFFGPNSKLRRQIIDDKDKLGYKGNRICRPDFAKLMARVFEIDVLECPRCKSRMQRISFIQDPKAILGILRSLKMGTAPPDIAEPPSCTIEYDLHQDDGIAEEELPSIEY